MFEPVTQICLDISIQSGKLAISGANLHTNIYLKIVQGIIPRLTKPDSLLKIEFVFLNRVVSDKNLRIFLFPTIPCQLQYLHAFMSIVPIS